VADPKPEFRSAWEFSRFEELWERFSPLTPQGKDEKEEREVVSDAGRLREIYDGTEAAIALLRSMSGSEADTLAYRLRRLPRLPFEDGSDPFALDLVGLFLVKKFLSNYRAILKVLDDGLRLRFGLAFESTVLAAELDRGGSDPETFAVSDRFDPALPELRAAIARTDAAIASSRAATKAAALRERGLDFGSRGFLVLPHERAALLLEPGPGKTCAFSVEAYDGASCIVRIQQPESELLLEEERAALGARERELEEAVIARLSALVAAEAGRLSGYARAIGEFDLARARAVLAVELELSRPLLSGTGSEAAGPGAAGPGTAGPEGAAAQRSTPAASTLAIEGGRHVGCEWDCARRGVAYAPLDLEIPEAAAAIFGSNMGGKTVALRTVAFLQIAAQAGLFVPARSFNSCVYSAVACLGEGTPRGGARGAGASGAAQGARGAAPDDEGGLSGFGFEIRAFAEAWDLARRGPTLVIMDEFARTTGSAEAEAIIAAALAALSSRPGTRCLISTHFAGLERSPGTAYLRMKGLDKDAAKAALAAEEPLPERIRRINGMMRYELERDSGERQGSDALAVARLLGLDPLIARDAERRWKERT